MSLAETVKHRALEIGFDLAGIAPLAAWEDLEFSQRWVERGYGGEMRYLANPKRHNPRLTLPSAKSIICVGLIYNADLPYSTKLFEEIRPNAFGGKKKAGAENEPGGQKAAGRGKEAEGGGARAWISRYAWGRDYHDVLRRKLEQLRLIVEALGQGVETRVYVDTGPIVERAFGRLSGIGWMGKNTCLINQQKGSWFFLGVILTSLELPPDLPAPDRCGSCTRCIEACPTGALIEPYVMDASRCIAYFTIELKGSIPAEFRPAIGANVFGCDICQDVCPWNGRSQESEISSQNSPARHKAATTNLEAFQPLQVTLEPPSATPEPRTFSLFNPPLDALASVAEKDFKRAFAHSPLKRAKYRGWLRNLCVAIGNSGDPRLTPHLEKLAAHADPIVREHAVWAIERLKEAP